ncbi:DUF5954 family protein [Streptomyces goshikiensis]|uniref:DUF5954 family protein n=1 Tax=Streptomyces goshikiensis TaxID=1942 RepID=UPI0036B6A640
MDRANAEQGGTRRVVVRVPVEPVEAAVEADAVDAVARAGDVMVRGPLFGVAVQDGTRTGHAQPWRVLIAVTYGCPQVARDSLNSLLWFRAKDEADDRAERRALLSAVARLESEPVDELAVAGARYRIVRAEEYAAAGAGGIEEPRPTDLEPLFPDWSRNAKGPEIDADLLLDPDAPLTPTQALERLALRGLSYTGERFPPDVRADARRALETHPDVLLLPPTFTVVEETERGGWKPAVGPHASAHEARLSLDFALTWAWPRMHGLIPVDTNTEADARTAAAAAAEPELVEYAAASDALRAGRVNRLEFQGTTYRVARTRRLLRWGPDGPEGPRPSDVNSQAPMRIHPALDEDGHLVPED